MLIREIINEKQVWARKGSQIVRKYKCTNSRRKGRVVSEPSQCFAPIDVKKKMNLKKIKNRLGTRLIRKSKKTKRVNPASKRIQTMNKAAK